MNKQKAGAGSSFRLGVAGKLLTGIIVPLVVILTLMAMLVVVQLTNIVSAMKETNIQNQIHAAAAQIEEYFEKFFVITEFTKDRSAVQQALLDAAANPEIPFDELPIFAEAQADLKHANGIGGSAVLSVWIASPVNNQLILSEGEITDPNFRVTERVWYKMLVENPGKSIISPAFQDSASGQMIITLASPYYDANQQLIGIIGLDITIDQLSSYLRSIAIGNSGYLTVYDSSNNIISHPDASYLTKNLNEIEYSPNIRQALDNNSDSDIMKYTRSDKVYYGSTQHLPGIGWTVLGCMLENEFTQETSLVTMTVLLGFLSCIVILIIICIFIAKKIVRPLHSLNTFAQEFANGNLEASIRKTSNDEVGDLTDVFIQMQVGLREIISDISHVLQELANKNLNIETSAEYYGDFAQIRNSVNNITERMNAVMSIINDTSNQVDSGASQVSNGAQALAQGSTEQASAVQELAATINEVSTHMQSMSQHAQEASMKADNVGSDVQQSSEKMQQMMHAMERIEQSSNEIQKIIKAIEDIAFQTNILALNAAVEAARAGSAGKGFAVVADEVRNLAGKSADASKTTATLISNSISAVKDGTSLAREATESLLSAVTDVQDVAGSIGSVSDALRDQASSMQQLTIGVDQISSVVQTNSATAEESAAASEELSAQATNLKNLMNEFNLKDSGNSFTM